jgi:hypothetical protein
MPSLRVRVLRDLFRHGIKTRVDCGSSPQDEIAAILEMGSDGWISIAPFPPGADRYEFIEILAFHEGAYQALQSSTPTAVVTSILHSGTFWVAVTALATVGLLVVGFLALRPQAHIPDPAGEPPQSQSSTPPMRLQSSTPSEPQQPSP